jgi:hypothetical protein
LLGLLLQTLCIISRQSERGRAGISGSLSSNALLLLNTPTLSLSFLLPLLSFLLLALFSLLFRFS